MAQSNPVTKRATNTSIIADTMNKRNNSKNGLKDSDHEAYAIKQNIKKMVEVTKDDF